MREVSFLNRLKELRQKNNLTLKQLGQKLNMLDSTLSQYETGKRNPKTEVWQKIADFFDVPVSYLRGIDADEIIEQVDFNKLSPLGLSFYEKENSNKDESLEATEIQLHEDMLNSILYSEKSLALENMNKYIEFLSKLKDKITTFDNEEFLNSYLMM